MRSTEMPLPLHDDATMLRIALDQAVARGTSAALIEFIMRNPDSAEAGTARTLLDQRREADPPGAATGPDAGLITAFDAARRAGSRDALAAFIAGAGGHPLAAEAGRLLARLP